jgi:uncharacterized membrane protein YbhN (UPF0104 family)
MHTPSPPARRFLAGLAVFALVVGGGAWLLRSLDLHAFADVLKEMAPVPLALAVLANLVVNYGARAQRWGALFHALPGQGVRLGFGERYSLSVAGQATNTIFPMRAGDAWRAVEVNRRHGVPLRDLIAVQLVEKVVEAIALGLLSLPALLSGRFVPRAVGAGIAVAVAVALGLAAFLYARGPSPQLAIDEPQQASRRGPFVRRAAAWSIGHLAAVSRALHSLAGTGGLWRSFFWALLSDLSDLAMIWLVARAAGFSIAPIGCAAVWAGVNVAIAVPAAPGQLGVLEAGAVLVLRALGAGDERALAIALAYHAAHIVPTLLAGIVALGLRSLTAPLRAPKAAAAPGPGSDASAPGPLGEQAS